VWEFWQANKAGLGEHKGKSGLRKGQASREEIADGLPPASQGEGEGVFGLIEASEARLKNRTRKSLKLSVIQANNFYFRPCHEKKK